MSTGYRRASVAAGEIIKPRKAFQIYKAVNYRKIKAEFAHLAETPSEFQKICVRKWSQLPASEKIYFLNEATKDQRRYEEELANPTTTKSSSAYRNYQEKLKHLLELENTIPSQQQQQQQASRSTTPTQVADDFWPKWKAICLALDMFTFKFSRQRLAEARRLAGFPTFPRNSFTIFVQEFQVGKKADCSLCQDEEQETGSKTDPKTAFLTASLKWTELDGAQRLTYVDKAQQEARTFHEQLELWKMQMIASGKSDLIPLSNLRYDKSYEKQRKSSSR